jgi:hypothetical protein
MLIQVICEHSDVSDHVSTAIVLFTHLSQKFDFSMSCDSTDVFVPHLELMATWRMLHHVTTLFGRSMSDSL